MAILQPILDIAEICHLHGVRHVVISPGSRSAALTLAFSRHGGFQMHASIDERAGGFIALGIAQKTANTVVLICTSGSAVYNLAPAVAEAFFQQIPLLILSADRPKEWIHQYDGQTIFQNHLFGPHVKKFADLPADYAHPDSVWAINRVVNEALQTVSLQPSGPVHLNVPIREPFYPKQDEILSVSAHVRKIERTVPDSILSPENWNRLIEEWHDAGRILIAVGQSNLDNSNWESLRKLAVEFDIPIVADCISNVGEGDHIIRFHDLFLPAADANDLRPDLLVTTGMSFISKELKQFLRRSPAKKHWHIGTEPFITDPLQSLTEIIAVPEHYFFETLFEKIDYELFVQNIEPENDTSFLATWQRLDARAHLLKENFLSNLSSLNDLISIDFIFKYLKEVNETQIGNSMPIRYANAVGAGSSQTQIRCNRGTSGIDGCVSTAIGSAIASDTPVFLLVGDVSFLYDRNGFLLQPVPSNLKIIVLNNGGGNIFRMIEGPAQLPELPVFFETRHQLTMERTCADAGITYSFVRNRADLESAVGELVDSKTASLLEIFTDAVENKVAWTGLKKAVADNIVSYRQ